jgi:predicted Na+-dependent transporter
MFTAHKKGNVALAFLFMITTTILFPVFYALHIVLFKTQGMDIKLGPVFLDAFLLITVPIVIAVIVKKFFSKTKPALAKITPNFNMFAIAFFAFVYFGASTSKLNLYYTPISELVAIVVIILFQDFGTYFLSKWFFAKIFSEEDAKTLSISLGMKNFAITGGLLLFYDPKASLASAIGFFIHSLYFSFLSYKAE